VSITVIPAVICVTITSSQNFVAATALVASDTDRHLDVEYFICQSVREREREEERKRRERERWESERVRLGGD
jgi:hypothetical protein